MNYRRRRVVQQRCVSVQTKSVPEPKFEKPIGATMMGRTLLTKCTLYYYFTEAILL